MKTARYLNPKINNRQFIPLRISLGAPKFSLSFSIAANFNVIAPTREILLITDKDAYRREYRRYLETLGVTAIRNALRPFLQADKETLLLCFEDLRDPSQWCHRRFFAEWWEEKTNERVPELEETPLERAAVKSETRQTTLF